MNEPEVAFDPYLPSFNLAPAAFPWSAAKVADVAEARAVTGRLFFDELLGMASVDASLYPPKDTLTLRHLLNSIQTCDFDRLKKDCLVFYLLLDYAGQEQAATFKDERALPARFARLTEGYWLLDGRRYEDAVKSLSQPSLAPDFVPKILRTLSLHPSPVTGARLVNRFLSLATPELTTDGEVDIKVDALARVNFREAWEFVESLAEGERKQDLVKRVIVATLAPKPVPAHLQLLLAFPFSAGSEQTLHALCLQPPSSLNKASTKVLHDLAHTRLIAQGRLLDAIRLDRSIGSGREGDQRRETIERLVRIVPEVQRRILEVEMSGGADKSKTAAGSSSGASAEYPPAPTPAATLVAPVPIPAAFQHQQNLPLSASQVLRTSSPQLSIHRAILSPAAAAPPSPARDGSASQQARRPFAFPAPLPGPSSPARSPFANADGQASPFGGRAAFASSSSSTTAAASGLPAHYLPQRQTIAPSPAASPARAPPVTASASPFAQAAKQASQAAYRSTLLSRDQRARQESPRFQSPANHRSSSFNRNDPADDEDDEMLVVESPPPAAVKRRSTGRQSKEKAVEKLSRPSRGKAAAEEQEKEAQQQQQQQVEAEVEEEDDTLPGAFPEPAASKTPTTRRKAASRVAAGPKASKTPPARPASGRGRRAPSVPGSFTTGATSGESADDDDEDEAKDELTLEDLASPGSSRRKPPSSSRNVPPPASSSGYGLRKGHVRTRSMSVASDSGSDDDPAVSEGKTPPPAHRRRTLRSSVTVSPEAVRRAPPAAGKTTAGSTKPRGAGSKLKESSTAAAAPTRRSTRRTAVADEH